MLRAALLRRSCDGAATELRRSCDGVAAATESLLRSSVALILRVASRRDALNEEPASFSLLLIQISLHIGHCSLPLVVAHSPGPVITKYVHNVGFG